MKNMVFALCILVVLISGCTNAETTEFNNTFLGESTLWTVEHHTKGTQTIYEIDGKLQMKNSGEDEWIFTYKNDLSEISTAKSIVIQYKTPSSEGKTEMEGPFYKKKFAWKTSGSNGHNNSYDSVNAYISIDGEEQEVILTKKQ